MERRQTTEMYNFSGATICRQNSLMQRSNLPTENVWWQWKKYGKVTDYIVRFWRSNNCIYFDIHCSDVWILNLKTTSNQAITITLRFQTSSKDTRLSVSLSCHLASIHRRALQIIYLLTYLIIPILIIIIIAITII